MEVRIGIQHTPKELVFESTLSAAEITKAINTAYNGHEPTVMFTDVKDRQYLVPLAALGYIEFGAAVPRKAGFVS